MPTPKKRTTTAKKTTAKKTARTPSRRTSRKRRSSKPKVVLSAQKVYLLSGIIIAICVACLAFSVLTANSGTDSSPNTKTSSSAKTSQAVTGTTVPDTQPVSQKKQEKTKKTQAERKQPAKSAQTESSAASELSPTPAAPAKSSAPSTPSSPQAQADLAQKNQPQGKTASVSPSTVNDASQKPVLQPDSSKNIASAKPDRQVQEPPAKTDRQEPQSPFAIPPARNGATLVLVIDDAGLHPEYVRRYTALPFPLAIAVLPRLSHSRECAQVVRAGYKELMLHQPMQAHAYPNGKVPNPGAGAVLPDMTTAQIASTVKANLDEIGPGVKGINNHEGSLVTEDVIKMGAVLEVAAERGVFFLDSRTTSSSAVPQAALERDMPYIARYAPFLDNKIDRTAMLNELYKGLEVANRNGYAVMIGHVDKSVNVLPQLLTDIYPYLVQAGYKFATPSQLR